MSIVKHHNGKTVHAHRMIVATARSMAADVYDTVMAGDNTLWAKWKAVCPELTPEKNLELFVDLLYPHLIEEARATLAKLLATTMNESLKSQIHDALIKDAPLRAGRLKARTGIRLT